MSQLLVLALVGAALGFWKATRARKRKEKPE